MMSDEAWFLEGDALRAIEAIVRRHVPPCLAVFGFATKRLSASDRPARYSVEVTLLRVNTEPEPSGWRQDLHQRPDAASDRRFGAGRIDDDR